ncbi:hypothetical protein PHJA_002423100 [Phtheirospermum japonicum]|uniref:MULE transposase domain-containing protein n=1 Tax=Phtheirospermum japonicum TaxID=374723 RepID=A0A830D8W8_9LAMI|nr:hypothetical protein PHJA_002423100 [Phtheirospermum japonicum]
MLRFVFWAFRPCIEAFKHCRKVISVDGTFLVGKYKHTLMMAVTVDANQQVVPLAYAVVDSKSALEQVPAFSSNVFCLRHVSSNFNTHAKSVKLKDMCFKAGAEPRAAVYHRIMEQIKALDPNAFAYLDGIDKSKWTLSHDGGKRCGILTTNMSECINGVMKCARRLPITTIVRITFLQSVQNFYERLKDATRLHNMQQFWPDKIYNLFRIPQSIEHTVQQRKKHHINIYYLFNFTGFCSSLFLGFLLSVFYFLIKVILRG